MDNLKNKKASGYAQGVSYGCNESDVLHEALPILGSPLD